MYGEGSLSDSSLTIPSSSVAILAMSDNIENNSADNESNDVVDNETGLDNSNTTDNATNQSENPQTDQEMQFCQGCCGNTFESPVADGDCPEVSCGQCGVKEQTRSNTVENLIRNGLVLLVVIALVFFIQINRRNGGNH